ncbi:unnamed protein product, partial [Ascophyllum nodosum]
MPGRTSTLTWSTILELEITTPRQHLRVAARDRKASPRFQTEDIFRQFSMDRVRDKGQRT